MLKVTKNDKLCEISAFVTLFAQRDLLAWHNSFGFLEFSAQIQRIFMFVKVMKLFEISN